MRKKILAALLAATVVATSAVTVSADYKAPEGVDPSEYHLAICIHSMDNEYWAQEAAGAKLAAEYYGVNADILTCDFSTLHEHISAIQEYTGAIISNINGSPFNIKEDGLNYFSSESKSAKLFRELRKIKEGEKQ